MKLVSTFSVIALAASLTQGVTAQTRAGMGNIPSCSGYRDRKEVRDLTPTEFTSFAEAFQSIATDGVLERIVNKHMDGRGGNWGFAHFSPYFLPWHRCYLREMEDALMDAGMTIALPYWDWSRNDSQNPHRSVLLTSRFFGTNDPDNDYTIVDGPFSRSKFQVTVPNTHPLRRVYDTNSISAFYHYSVLNSLRASSLSFSKMSSNIEYGPHAVVHTYLGGNGQGDNGDLSTMYSPNDPLFWMHHSFVDKLWYDWQAQGNNIAKFDGVSYGGQFTTASSNNIIQSYNVPVNFVLNSVNLCVRYRQPVNIMQGGTNSTNLTEIKAPEEPPSAWFNNTGVNRTIADAVINQTQQTVAEVNKNISLGIPIASPATAPVIRKVSNDAVTMGASMMGPVVVASVLYLLL